MLDVLFKNKRIPKDRCTFPIHAHVHLLKTRSTKGGNRMYGTFGAYTRWAVVFLIIFVLFFLLVPGYYGAPTAAAPAYVDP
jgi:hypothetical protein